MVLVCTSEVASCRVRALLRKNHMTQRMLADGIGTSYQLLNAKLRGRSNYTLHDLSRIADFFGVSVDALIGRAPLEVE